MTISTESEFRATYPAIVSIPVHWGEQDGFGHVNNAVFIRWFESARIEHMNLIEVELTTEGVGPILAAVSCDFRLQVKYPDTVLSGARIVRIGNSSLKIEHAIFSTAQSAVVAEGDSTVVMFDYEKQKSSPICDEKLALIERVSACE